ncbi:MAG: aminopeptidase P family protein [Lachnospiraceae bacterium]|nr:aminopeptidase P family protein [Lachnospiraceae bacterium]
MKRQSTECYISRLEALRNEMNTAGVYALYIPCGDFHMSEYISDHFKCREYISGFDGSNGEMIITSSDAYLWTDGRYFLQAEAQLEGTGIMLMKMGEPGVPSIGEFIRDEIPEGAVLAFDGRCVSGSFFDGLKEKLGKKNLSFITDIDLVGRIWEDRPALPDGKAWILDESFTGQSRLHKLELVRKLMSAEGCDTLIVSSLDDIAWLYQFRGNDIDYNPVTLSYALIREDEALLYIDPHKASEIRDELTGDGIMVRDYEEIFEDIPKLQDIKRVWYDPECTNLRLVSLIPDNVETVKKWIPPMALKAVKTETESENERSAHISDGVAVTRIIHYLKSLHGTAELAEGRITELDVAKRLLGYRKEAEDFIEESFAPIIAAGPHGAIIHYEPDAETNIPIMDDNLVLMDTGGQYMRGTTDITRTICIGTPSPKMMRLYTAVLKGNIALSSAVFKKGTSGKSLDILARSPLWEIGYDYRHGTGHGVGYLLNVHEGPQSISNGPSKRGDTPLEPGMITSDEPGVYIDGEFGIRTENMILCVPKDENEYGKFLGFDVLTMVPYDRDLIDTGMLTPEEIRKIDDYHKAVFEKISPFVDEEVKKWLSEATGPLQV